MRRRIARKCHAAATVNTHANGSINLPGTLAVTYSGGDTVVALNGGSFGTCTGPATGCHMGSVTPNWNGGTTNCGTCHGYPPSVGTSHLDANRTGYTNNDTTFLARPRPVRDLPRGRREHDLSDGSDRVRDTAGQDAGRGCLCRREHARRRQRADERGGRRECPLHREHRTTTRRPGPATTPAVTATASNSTRRPARQLVELREFGIGTCDGCHGGGTVGTSANNYWPDSSDAAISRTRRNGTRCT